MVVSKDLDRLRIDFDKINSNTYSGIRAIESPGKLKLIDRTLINFEKSLDKIIRKRNKFLRDPYNFFGDSRNFVFNKLKYFYKKP